MAVGGKALTHCLASAHLSGEPLPGILPAMTSVYLSSKRAICDETRRLGPPLCKVSTAWVSGRNVPVSREWEQHGGRTLIPVHQGRCSLRMQARIQFKVEAYACTDARTHAHTFLGLQMRNASPSTRCVYALMARVMRPYPATHAATIHQLAGNLPGPNWASSARLMLQQQAAVGGRGLGERWKWCGLRTFACPCKPGGPRLTPPCPRQRTHATRPIRILLLVTDTSSSYPLPSTTCAGARACMLAVCG